MSGPFDYLDSQIVDKLEPVWKFFIPNEKVEIAIQTSDGFLVFTNRRLVFLDSKKEVSKSIITRAFQLDVLHSLYEKKEGKWRLETIKLGKLGNLEGKMKDGEMKYKTRDFEFKPNYKSKTDKETVLQRFTDGMNSLNQRIEEKVRIISDPEYVQIPDYTYLIKEVPFEKRAHGLLSLSLDDSTPVFLPMTDGIMGMDHEKLSYYTRYKTPKGYWFENRGGFPHALVRCLEYRPEMKRYPTFYIHFLKYNREQQKMELDDMGKPKIGKILFGKESVPSENQELWMWPAANLPWIVADAYYYKIEKLIPANIPKTETEKTRLWY